MASRNHRLAMIIPRLAMLTIASASHEQMTNGAADESLFQSEECGSSGVKVAEKARKRRSKMTKYSISNSGDGLGMYVNCSRSSHSISEENHCQ